LTFKILDPDTGTALMLFPREYSVLVGDNGIFSVDLKVADSCQGPGLTDVPDPRTVIKPGTTLTYCSDESCTCHNPEGSEYKVAFAPLAVRADVATELAFGAARIEGDVDSGVLTLHNYNHKGSGLSIEPVDYYGVEIQGANMGIKIGNASYGLWIDPVQFTGVSVQHAGAYGLEVKQAEGAGVSVESAGKPSATFYDPQNVRNGFQVAGAQGNGLYVGRADQDGVHVRSAGQAGVSVETVGKPSTTRSDPQNMRNGFQVAGAQGNGLYVGRADQDGVRVESAGRYAGYFNGRVRVNVLEITGGSDLAEPFEIVDEESVQPGMVVAIDPRHPGSLRIADQPYDRTVAGIISGAGDIKPGVLMGQTDSDAAGAMPVALSGRVYCNVDAAYGAIQPGDLLTTSPTRGYAMVVKDYARAQGAILGKAMQGLPEGQKGQILVLVTLQ
jgi:hypothetical protein